MSNVAEPRTGGTLYTVDKVIGWVSLACVVVAAVWTVIVMLWVVADVAGRVSGVVAIVGTPEIAQNSVVGITFLCIPYAMRRGGHVRSTIVVDRLPTVAKTSILTVAYVAGGVVFAGIAWVSWEPMLASFARGEYEGEGALRVPTYPLRALIVGASVLMAVECILAARRVVAAARRNRDVDAETDAEQALPAVGN